VVQLSAAERQAVIESGLQNAKRFNTDDALNKIEKIYSEIVATHN
jgi:hypothetical protein